MGENMLKEKTKEYSEAQKEVTHKFWKDYLRDVKLWVTETSCSGDWDWNKENKQKNIVPSEEDLVHMPANECRYITGQDCQRKEGSVAAMRAMPNIERISWFTFYPALDVCGNCWGKQSHGMMFNPKGWENRVDCNVAA